MTAAAKPGRHEGGGALDCRTRDLVLMEGGRLGLLPLPPGIWFVREGMCYLVWRHCVAMLPVVS